VPHHNSVLPAPWNDGESPQILRDGFHVSLTEGKRFFHHFSYGSLNALINISVQRQFSFQRKSRPEGRLLPT